MYTCILNFSPAGNTINIFNFRYLLGNMERSLLKKVGFRLVVVTKYVIFIDRKNFAISSIFQDTDTKFFEPK